MKEKNKQKRRVRHKKPPTSKDKSESADSKGLPTRTYRKHKRIFKILAWAAPIVIGIIVSWHFYSKSPTKDDIAEAVKTTIANSPELLEKPFSKVLSDAGILQSDKYRGVPKTMKEIKESIVAKYPDAQTKIVQKAQMAFDALTKEDYLNAELDYRALVRIYPELPEFHFNLAQALIQEDKFKEALKELQVYSELSPDDAKGYLNLGFVMKQLNKTSDAILSYKKALEFEPENRVIYFNLGSAFSDDKQYENAKEAFTKALPRNPRDSAEYSSHVYVNLAAVYQDQRLLDQAIKLYKTALSLDSTNPFAYHNMGIAYARKGQIDSCAWALGRALTFKPELSYTRYFYAQALNQLGRVNEANFQVEFLFQIDPGFFVKIMGDSIK